MSKLLATIRTNDFKEFQYLLKKKGIPSSKSNSDYKLLKKALLYGRVRIALALLERGCRAYNEFYDCTSPLHLAVLKRNCRKLILHLLDRGARIDQKNYMEDTPVHVAFYRNNGKAIDLMLERYFKTSVINECNKIDMTFLHIAATRSHENNMRLLLEYGNVHIDSPIDVTSKSPYAGFTPLHMAVKFGRVRIAQMLLKYGASLWTRTGHGFTPLLIALERKNRPMVEMLLAFDCRKKSFDNKYKLRQFTKTCVFESASSDSMELSYPVDSDGSLVNKCINNCITKSDDLNYPFKYYTALNLAVECNRDEVVKLMCEDQEMKDCTDCVSEVVPMDIYEEHETDESSMMCGINEDENSIIFNNTQSSFEDMDWDYHSEFYEMVYSEDNDTRYYDVDGDLEFWEDDIRSYKLK